MRLSVVLEGRFTGYKSPVEIFFCLTTKKTCKTGKLVKLSKSARNFWKFKFLVLESVVGSVWQEVCIGFHVLKKVHQADTNENWEK